MHFQSPGPFFINIGFVTIRWYGVLIALGFVCAAIMAHHLAKRWRLDAEQITNMCLISFIGGIIGGRLYFVALNWSSFWAQPSEIIAMWHGGMSIHGGIIGGFLTGGLYCHFTKLPVLRCMDLGGCALPLAQAIGRWGNFFNSEAFGRPVPDDFPLKLFIPRESRGYQYFNHEYFHPTFLYESIWNLLVFLFLYYVASKKLYKYPGLLFLLYIDLYSLGRLIIEPMRVDSIMAGSTPVPIIASAAGLVGSSVLFLALLAYYKRKGIEVGLPEVAVLANSEDTAAES
jgi:phosphatidylglycerol:prolipoprotein diacylglycerol transferase